MNDISIENKVEVNGLDPDFSAPEYKNPAETEYPVIAYNDVSLQSGVDTTPQQIRALLQTVKDCGFNVNLWANGYYTNENIMNANFEIAQDLGLQTVLNIAFSMPVVRHKDNGPNNPVGIYFNPSLENLESVLNLYKGTRNLWGYMLKDEPSYASWGLAEQEAGTVALVPAYNTYLMNADEHIAFFNLAVAIDEATIGSELANSGLSPKQKYSKFLQNFWNQFHPSLMSVDLYPVIRIDPSTDYTIKAFYYYSMEAIAEFSAQYKTPFWLYLLSNKHILYYYKPDGTVEKREYPYPSVSILRYQAMTALAYGIQGLVFWTYGKRANTLNADGKLDTEFINAPYENGHITEVWNNCKAVISVIKQYGKILLNAKFEEARHVYGPLLTKAFDETTTFSSAVGCIISASASGMGFVITRLTKGDIRYVAIVSHDPYREQNIRFTIPKSYNWHEVLLKDQAVESQEVFSEKTNSNIDIAETITRTLGPGQMILISY